MAVLLLRPAGGTWRILTVKLREGSQGRLRLDTGQSGWKVMSSAKGYPGSFKRRGRNDSFKTPPPFKPHFQLQLDPWFLDCCLSFDSHCLPSASREGFWLPHPSLPSYFWVSVKCGFSGRHTRVSHSGRPTHMRSPVMAGVGCGEPVM